MKVYEYRGKVERDLRCYLDWNIRIESVETVYGCIEELDDIELINIKRKVLAITKIFNRLSDKNKVIIMGKYFHGHSRERLLKDSMLSKNELYVAIKRMIVVFGKEIYHS